MEAALLLQRSAIVLFGGCNAAHFGAMWRRMGRQRAVAGEGTPGVPGLDNSTRPGVPMI
jgi:hypothetical protein